MATDDLAFPEMGGVSSTGEVTDIGASSNYDMWDDLASPTGANDGSETDPSALGYAADLTKQQALDMMLDTRFLQDIYDYYYEKDGETFSTPEMAIDKFFSDRAWSNLNTVSVLYDTYDSFTNNDIQNGRLARLQNVYDQMPNFYEKGGRGAEGLWQNFQAVILDPVNLLGFGFGGAGAKAAARAASYAGKPNVFRAGVWGGVKRGAASEGAIGAGTEAIHSGGTQTRNMQLGLQQDFSVGQLAGATALGGAAGAGLGGLFGALGAVNPFRPEWNALKRQQNGWNKGSAINEGAAEGKLLKEIEEADVANGQIIDTDGLSAESETFYSDDIEIKLGQRVGNELDASGISADEINAAATSGQFVNAKGEIVQSPTLEEILTVAVKEGRIELEHKINILKAQEALSRHQYMKSAGARVQRLYDAADALEKSQLAEGAAVDPKEPLAGASDIARLRSQANLLDLAHKKWQKALTKTNPDPDEITEAARAFEAEVGIINDIDPAPAGARVAPDPADIDPAQREANIDMGLEEEAPVAREAPETTPEAEAQEGIAPEDADAEVADTAHERFRQEDQLKELDALINERTTRVKNLRKKIAYAKKHPESDGAKELPELEAQLIDETNTTADRYLDHKANIADRAKLRKAIKEADAETPVEDQIASGDEMLRKIKAAVEGTGEKTPEPEGVKTDTDEKIQDAVDFLEDPDAPDLTDAAYKQSVSEAKTIEFIKAIDKSLTPEDIRAIRKELRELVKGIKTQVEKETARSGWMLRKLDEMQAKVRVGAIFDGLSKEAATHNMPYGDLVFQTDAVETLLRVQIDKDPALKTQIQKDQAFAAAQRAYDKYLNENAVRLFADLVEGMGDEFTPQDLLEEVTIRYGEKTHDILARQMFDHEGFQWGVRGLDTSGPQRVDTAVVKEDDMADFPQLERDALKGVFAKWRKKNKHMNEQFQTRVINNRVAEHRANRITKQKQFRAHGTTDIETGEKKLVDVSIGNEGMSEIIVIDGVRFKSNVGIGKPQGALSGPHNWSNKHGFRGPLLDTLLDNGEKLNGLHAVMTANKRASLETATLASVKDKFKFWEVTREVVVDGELKKVKEYGGANAAQVLELRAARKAIKELEPDDPQIAEYVGEMRSDLVARGLIPPVKHDVSAQAVQRIELGSMHKTSQMFPDQTSDQKFITQKGKDVGGRQFFAYKKAVGKNGQLLKHKPSGKKRVLMDFGVERDPKKYKLEDPKTHRAKIDKYEVIDDVVYEKQIVKEAVELERKGGTTYYDKGDTVYADPVTGRMYISPDDAPYRPNVVDTQEALLKDIQYANKELTLSPDVSVKAQEAIVATNSKPAVIAKIAHDMSSLKQTRAKIDHTSKDHFDISERIRLQDQIKALNKEGVALTGDPKFYKNRNLWMKGKKTQEDNQLIGALINVNLGDDLGVVGDTRVVANEVKEILGVPEITEEHQIIARGAADKIQEANSYLALKRDLTNAALERYRQLQDKDLLHQELLDIDATIDEIASGVAPDKKPVGREVPEVVHHAGVEVDVANHFHLEGTGATQNVKFLGKVVGTLTKEGDKYVLDAPEMEFAIEIDHPSQIKRELVKSFETRIKQAQEAGHLKPSTLAPEGSGRSFKQDNWTKSDTYKNTPKEGLDAPIDETRANAEEMAANSTNELVHRSVTSWDDEVPQGRQLSIYLETGEFKTHYRNITKKQHDADIPLSKVLGKQVDETFILGHVDSSKTGAAREATFQPLESMDVEGITPAPKPKPPAEGPARIADNPDVVDPATRPISFNQARNLEIDQSKIPIVNGESQKGKFKFLNDVLAEIENLENMPWNAPHFQTNKDYLNFVKYMEFLNDVVSHYAPHGLKWNNASRNRSMAQLNILMEKHDFGEVNAVMSVLNHVAGAQGKLPRFRNDPTGFAYTRHTGKAEGATGEYTGNTISIGKRGDGTASAPDFQKVIHEIGHWAYSNILSPKEKSMFWEAMGRYISDEGVDTGSLKRRLPGTAKNELDSPAEFFAQQFSQFAISRGKAGTPTELMTLWAKVAYKIREVMEKFFLGSETDFIDPALIPLFERILPDRDFTTNKYSAMHKKLSLHADKKKPGRVKYLADKLLNWETIKGNIEEAIRSGDPERIRSALGGRRWADAAETNTFVQEAIGYKGVSGTSSYLNSKGKRVARVRLLDEGKQKVDEKGPKVDKLGRPIFTFMNAFHIRNHLLRKMKEIQRFHVQYPDQNYAKKLESENLQHMATGRSNAEEARRTAEIDEIYNSSLDTDGLMDIDKLGYHDPAITIAEQKGDQEVIDRLIKVANSALNVIHEIQVEMGRQVGRNFKKVPGPKGSMQGIRIDIDTGEIVATHLTAQRNSYKQATIKRRENLENQVAADVEERAADLDADMAEALGYGPTTPINNPTGTVKSSAAELSMPEKLGEVSETPIGSKRKQVDITFKNGDRYTGEANKDGWPHGVGDYTFPNGDKYTGKFKNAKRHGQGTYSWIDGTTYEGEWKGSQKSGHGIYIKPDGSKYVGGYKADQRWGQGVLTEPDGGRYEGEFADGEPQGQGTYTFANGDTHTGRFKKGVATGKGVHTYANGDSYTGSYKNDLADGKGTLTRADGTKHTGKWVEGYLVDSDTFIQHKDTRPYDPDRATVVEEGGAEAVFRSFDEITAVDTDQYVGESLDGIPHGKGTKLSPNRDRYEGEFKDGKEHGHGTETIFNGSTYTGAWVNGRKEGPGIMIFPNGHRVEGLWKNGGIVKGTEVKTKGPAPGSEPSLTDEQLDASLAEVDALLETYRAWDQTGRPPKALSDPSLVTGNLKFVAEMNEMKVTDRTTPFMIAKTIDEATMRGKSFEKKLFDSRVKKPWQEQEELPPWQEGGTSRQQPDEPTLAEERAIDGDPADNWSQPDIEDVTATEPLTDKQLTQALKEVEKLLNTYRGWDQQGRPPKELSDTDNVTEGLKYIAEQNGIAVVSRTTPYSIAKSLDENMEGFADFVKGVVKSKAKKDAVADTEKWVDAQKGSLESDTDILRETGINKEALDFINSVKDGAPTQVTNNLKRIARENGLKISKMTRPEDIAAALERTMQEIMLFPKAEKMSIPEISKELLESRDIRAVQFIDFPDDPKKMSARQIDLNRALQRALDMAPEITEIDYLAEAQHHPVMVPDFAVGRVDASVEGGGMREAESPFDFHEAIVRAFEAGNEDDMILAAAGLKHLFHKNPDILPKSNLVNRAMDTDIKQNRGVSDENAIPDKAPIEVKEILRKITHRNKKIEADARTLTYRMMNLMGKTQQNAVDNTNVMSVADVQKLFGADPVDGQLGVFRHATEGAEFNMLRKTMRKMGAALKEQTGGGADFIGIRPPRQKNSTSQPYTVIHEIGHLLVRGTFDPEQRKTMTNMYKQALEAGEDRALDTQKHYSSYLDPDTTLPPQLVQDRLAEEWFVDGFHDYLRNRVNKTNMFGNVPMAHKLATMVDNLIERVMYMVNGLIGNKSLRQTYRYLTFGGDMLANKAGLNTPVRSAVRNTGSFAMNPEVATRYAQETVDYFDVAREVHAREFVGVGEAEHLMNYVYYHGVPDGGSYSRFNNPDVILEPSGPEALFGEGIYVSKSDGLAVDHSEVTTAGELAKLIKDKNLSPSREGIGLEQASDIAANRIKITDELSFMNGTRYRESTINRAKGIERGEIKAVEEDPAYTLLQSWQRLSALYQEETKLWKLFQDTTGITRQPKVLPLFVRAHDTFHFDANTYYSIGGGVFNQNGSDISWLLSEMANKKMFTQKEGRQLIETLSKEDAFPADQFYETVIDALTRKGVSNSEAKNILTTFMRDDLGYDSFKVTDIDPVTGREGEALVVFDSTQVKHVDADVYDSDMPNIYADMIGEMGDRSLGGKIISDSIEVGRNINPGDYVNVAAEAQRIGVPDALQSLIRRSLRQEHPTIDDFNAVQRHSGQGKGGNWIRENSIHLRRIGAHWFGNIVKPEGGAGLFQKQSSDLAGKVAPLIQALRELPDAGNAGTRWLKKNRGLAYPVHKGLGTPPPPASHQRIINALRSQDLTTLKPDEQKIAMDIAASFKSELTNMRSEGLPIGDVSTKLGQKYYVPQIWDISLIQKSPGKFNDMLVRWFMRDARGKGIQMDIREANQISTDIINRMIDTDGRIDVDNVLHRRMSGSSNPFLQRFLTLGPDDIPEFGTFMIRDLEGIISRYFDKTTRVTNMAREFGINGHAADAYIAVSRNGMRQAVDVLLHGKTTTASAKEMGVDVKITDDIVPKILKTQEEAETLVLQVTNILGSTMESKTNNKQEAINLLLNAIDVTRLDKGQYDQFKLRAKAVVNALADFENPASDDAAKWMMKYMEVLNRKPLGSERAYAISRGMRTFNSVSLLTATTLTSFPDVVLPLIRTGSMGSWMKGWSQRWMGDPSYKQAARDIGVGIENLIHDNMTHMAGDGSQRFTHAFFNATLLTPWTNMQREVSALVGFNALKAEADAARRQISNGSAGSRRHRTAIRFLKRYGLEEYGQQGGPRLDDIRTHTKDDKVRYAIMRFVNETIFTPDPNDVPMWAQTPVGSLVFQLKSFPIMMGRMAKDVIREAKKGNTAPLAMLLTVGAGFGMGANAAKDLILARGGEKGDEHKLRDRKLSDTFIGTAVGWTGFDIDDMEFMNTKNEMFMGLTPNEWLGWWVEGLLAMGGLGLIAEGFADAARMTTKGMYGVTRVLAAAGGLPVSGAIEGIEAVSAAVTQDPSQLSKVGGSMGRRVPGIGPYRPFQMAMRKLFGGEPKKKGRKAGDNWIKKHSFTGLPKANTKQRDRTPPPMGAHRQGPRPMWPMPGDEDG